MVAEAATGTASHATHPPLAEHETRPPPRAGQTAPFPGAAPAALSASLRCHGPCATSPITDIHLLTTGLCAYEGSSPPTICARWVHFVPMMITG